MPFSSLPFHAVGIFTSLLLSAPLAHAGLIGLWTFEGPQALEDAQGNFGTLQLEGQAHIQNGSLVLSGQGNQSTGWAHASMVGHLPDLSNKTLVVWATLTGLSNTANSGGLLGVDARTYDRFDSIVLGERSTDQWMNGSSYWQRTQNFNATESTVGTPLMMAISYLVNAGQVAITGYRNGEQIGQYTSSAPAVWSSDNLEVLFGPRHTQGGNVYGGLNAQIHEARLYDTALSAQEVSALRVSLPVSEPHSHALVLTSLGMVAWSLRRRKV